MEINHIIRIFNKYKFDEVYNMAAQSLATSFSNPITTADVTGIGVLRILEVIKNLKKKTEILPSFIFRNVWRCIKITAGY